MTFDLISGLHMQIQTWHPPLWLCTHAKYYVKSGLTNVLKNANKTKNMHLFSIRIANYYVNAWIITSEFNNQSIMHNMHSQGMHYTANRTLQLQQPVSSPGLLFKRQRHVFAAWSRHDWCRIQIQLLQ